MQRKCVQSGTAGTKKIRSNNSSSRRNTVNCCQVLQTWAGDTDELPFRSLLIRLWQLMNDLKDSMHLWDPEIDLCPVFFSVCQMEAFKTSINFKSIRFKHPLCDSILYSLSIDSTLYIFLRIIIIFFKTFS